MLPTEYDDDGLTTQRRCSDELPSMLDGDRRPSYLKSQYSNTTSNNFWRSKDFRPAGDPSQCDLSSLDNSSLAASNRGGRLMREKIHTQ